MLSGHPWTQDPSAHADPMYRNFTDADLAAIFTYLQSIPPISNHVPDPLAPVAVAATERE